MNITSLQKRQEQFSSFCPLLLGHSERHILQWNVLLGLDLQNLAGVELAWSHIGVIVPSGIDAAKTAGIILKNEDLMSLRGAHAVSVDIINKQIHPS